MESNQEIDANSVTLTEDYIVANYYNAVILFPPELDLPQTIELRSELCQVHTEPLVPELALTCAFGLMSAEFIEFTSYPKLDWNSPWTVPQSELLSERPYSMLSLDKLTLAKNDQPSSNYDCTVKLSRQLTIEFSPVETQCDGPHLHRTPCQGNMYDLSIIMTRNSHSSHLELGSLNNPFMELVEIEYRLEDDPVANVRLHKAKTLTSILESQGHKEKIPPTPPAPVRPDL